MTVVTDSSPLVILSKIDSFDVLKQLFSPAQILRFQADPVFGHYFVDVETVRHLGLECCDKLTQMARSALQYVFAALLALLTTQAVIPSVGVAATVEIVCCSEAKRQIVLEAQCMRVHSPFPQSPAYGSRTRPEPDAAVLFQRPPP